MIPLGLFASKAAADPTNLNNDILLLHAKDFSNQGLRLGGVLRAAIHRHLIAFSGN